MWNERRATLQARQQQLVARSHALRERLEQHALVLERPLALADRVRHGARWLISHPWWIAAGAALPVVLRPRRAAGWAVKLWWGWRMWRRVQPLLPYRGRR
jgi:YqjK-like protein